jgi:hypothetical protein
MEVGMAAPTEYDMDDEEFNDELMQANA